jgi:hypothetical protein
VEKTVNLLRGFNKKYKRIIQSLCIITAQQHISPEEIVKGFTECCISSVVDGTDGDMLWNGSEEGGSVRGECEEDEDTDCEDGDSDNDW